MPTIVVADDELPIAQLIEDILTEEGFNVHLATDGRQALILARSLQPDLVLCDIMMPLLSGEEVYHALQEDPKTRDIPVVLMSAASARQGYANSSNFLAKPFELEQLLAIIDRFINRGS